MQCSGQVISPPCINVVSGSRFLLLFLFPLALGPKRFALGSSSCAPPQYNHPKEVGHIRDQKTFDIHSLCAPCHQKE